MVPPMLRNRVLCKRSIYVAKDIQQGELFSTDNLRILRPGDGAPPAFYEQLIGRKSPQSLTAGSPLLLDKLF